MCYRCTVCAAKVPAGHSRLVHIVHREDGQIARELAVCGSCKAELDSGTSLFDLHRLHSLLTNDEVRPVQSSRPVAVAVEPARPDHQPFCFRFAPIHRTRTNGAK